MTVEIHVREIEAIGQGSVLVSVVIESEHIGSIELEAEGATLRQTRRRKIR